MSVVSKRSGQSRRGRRQRRERRERNRRERRRKSGRERRRNDGQSSRNRPPPRRRYRAFSLNFNVLVSAVLCVCACVFSPQIRKQNKEQALFSSFFSKLPKTGAQTNVRIHITDPHSMQQHTYTHRALRQCNPHNICMYTMPCAGKV